MGLIGLRVGGSGCRAMGILQGLEVRGWSRPMLESVLLRDSL